MLQIVAPDNIRVVIRVEQRRRSVELCHHFIPRQRLKVVNIEASCFQLFLRMWGNQLVVQLDCNRHFYKIKLAFIPEQKSQD